MKIAAVKHAVWVEGAAPALATGLARGQGALPDLETADWIGFSTRHVELLNQGAGIAHRGSPLLVLGEKGVGKRRLAKWIHKIGPLSSAGIQCFFPVGDATEEAIAAWEEAWRVGRGSYFIEEIAALPLPAQHRLAESIAASGSALAGGSTPDKRLFCSSSENLKALVRAGKFDSDLYFLLMPCSLQVPSLAERTEDIIPLAKFFAGSSAAALSAEVLRFLHEAYWPGNLSQLRAVVQRAVLAAATSGAVVSLPEIQECYDLFSVSAGPEKLELRVGSLENMEKEYIFLALKSVRFNKTQAARLLGIDRATLYRKAHRYGISLDASHGSSVR